MDAVVIDLSRIPSQGRDLAIAMRLRKGTRQIPIVFLSGDPSKVQKIRPMLPDAEYAQWDDVVPTLMRAIAADMKDFVVPESAFAAYAGKSLADKLGIKAGTRTALIRAPSELAELLQELPPGASLTEGPDEGADLMIWFMHSVEQLRGNIGPITAGTRRRQVWIAWPKKGSDCEGDLSEKVVRETGISAGMVDYKICSIDRNWSALRFAWRGS